MTKQEFYEKYNKILTQHSVDTLSLYHKVLAIIQADNFMDEEQGNSKPLNIDDFAYTLNSDMQLKNIFRTSTLKVNMQVSKAKEMYEIQLYRLLLDALILQLQVTDESIADNCGLLSPCAKNVATILGINVGLVQKVTYADEETCLACLNTLLKASIKEQREFDKFLEVTKKIVTDDVIKKMCTTMLDLKDIDNQTLLERTIKNFSDLLMTRIISDYKQNKVRCSFELGQLTKIGVLDKDNNVLIESDYRSNQVNVLCVITPLATLFDKNKVCDYTDYINLISNLIICDTLEKPDVSALNALL